MIDLVKALRSRATWETATGITEPHEHIDWMAADEITRLREALEPISKIKAFTCIYEWVPVEALRDDEEVNVKLTGAQIKKMREAAIREGGKDD